MATISLQSLAGRGFPVFDRPSKSGTISRCLFHANASVCWTHIGSPVFGHWSWFVVSSATHGHASSRLNIHLHCLVLDGVYRCGADGVPVFVEARAPSDDELHALLHTVITKLMAVPGNSRSSPPSWSAR